MRNYIRLSDDFVLKGSVSQQVLASLRQYQKYVLDAQQFEFMKLCNGKMTTEEILNLYHPDDHSTIKEFLKNLQNFGAIIELDHPTFRDTAVNLVPDTRLQAVHFEITKRCNMHCVHCYHGNQLNAQDDIPFNIIEGLIVQMKNLQVEHVNLGGGEPLIRPDIFDIIDAIEGNCMRISSLFTNGLLLTENTIERFIRCRSIFTVYVSLDAITPEGMIFRGYQARQGKQVLERIIKQIKNATSQGTPVVVNTLLTKHTVANLYKMYDVIRNLNVTSWRLGFPKNVGLFIKNHALFKDSWESYMRACLGILKHHFAEKEPFHFQIEYLYRKDLFENKKLFLSDDDFVCDYEGRREGCCIRPNSDVVSCAYGINFPLGNVLTSQLWDIWYSSEMKRIKNTRIKDVGGCKNCFLRPLCATGCRFNAYFLGGNMNNSPDYDACLAVKFFIKEVFPLIRENISINSETVAAIQSLVDNK